MYQITLITSSQAFKDLSGQWNTILSQSSSDNFFLRWEWLWYWWEVFKRDGQDLRILIVEKDGELAGIAPLYLSIRKLGRVYPVRRLMFLGTSSNFSDEVGSDRMDVISKKGFERDVTEALLDYIRKNDLCDELYLSSMDASARTFGFLKDHAVGRGFLSLVYNPATDPYIPLPLTWERFLEQRSPSMRAKIRKEMRRWHEREDYQLRQTESLEHLDEDFQRFIALHQARWISRGRPGAFANEKFTAFHEKVIHHMMKNGHLRLLFLTEGGVDKAAVYNIAYNNKIYFYLSGLDVSNSKGALGYVIHSFCIQQAIEDGFSEYDFLLKGKRDDYKYHWTKEHRSLSDLYIAMSLVTKRYAMGREIVRCCYNRMRPVIKMVETRL